MDSTKNGNIYITGIQGSGKTTLASKYANETGYRIIHLDDFANKYPPEIVDEKVEEFVRNSNYMSHLIIEGVQLLDLVDLIDLDKHEFILIDKGFKKTAKQAWKRDKGTSDWTIDNKQIKTKKDFENAYTNLYNNVSKAVDLIKDNPKIKIIKEELNFTEAYNLLSELNEEYNSLNEVVTRIGNNISQNSPINFSAECFATYNPNDVIGFIKENPEMSYKIVWDKHLDLYVFGDAWNNIHATLFTAAYHEGVYDRYKDKNFPDGFLEAEDFNAYFDIGAGYGNYKRFNTKYKYLDFTPYILSLTFVPKERIEFEEEELIEQDGMEILKRSNLGNLYYIPTRLVTDRLVNECPLVKRI